MESYRQKFIQTGKFAPMKHFMVREGTRGRARDEEGIHSREGFVRFGFGFGFGAMRCVDGETWVRTRED